MPRPKVAVRQKTFVKIIVIASLFVIVLGGGLSYYFMIYRVNNNPAIAIPTSAPSATPTPAYMGFINQPPNYVGEIEAIDETEIMLLREDGSRVVLNVRPEIPIYQVVNSPDQLPDIITLSIDSLQIGNTLSVYSQDKKIAALFLLHD